MLDRMTNKRVVIGLIIARIVTGIIAMPTTEGSGTSNQMTTYTQIDSVFRLISTILMVLIIIIALNALGNMSKNKNDNDEDLDLHS